MTFKLGDVVTPKKAPENKSKNVGLFTMQIKAQAGNPFIVKNVIKNTCNEQSERYLHGDLCTIQNSSGLALLVWADEIEPYLPEYVFFVYEMCEYPDCGGSNDMIVTVPYISRHKVLGKRTMIMQDGCVEEQYLIEDKFHAPIEVYVKVNEAYTSLEDAMDVLRKNITETTKNWLDNVIVLDE